MSVIVNDENKEQYPAPVGTVVKWSRWQRWTDPTTGAEGVRYSLRCTESPLPKDRISVFSGPDDSRAFLQVLPAEADGSEGIPIVIPFRTFWAEFSNDGTPVRYCLPDMKAVSV